ncbi:MAG: hypothetical protein DMG24_16365 [Acidobacteria bacterium]|nr:MAG: hypothetical protein DMG24_16365 [Acidobacteriota bacterium]
MKGHSTGNGHQTKLLGRELRRAERLADRLDRVVALADSETGVGAPESEGSRPPQRLRGGPEWAQGHDTTAGDTPNAPFEPVPIPTPGSVPRGDFEATFGVSGTLIVSGFLSDLGEYNPELAGRNAIPTYEKMRRGDAQVRATLAACKLPIQSAKWEVIPAGAGLAPPSEGAASSASTSSTGAGRATEAKAKEIAAFVRDNLFGGLEFRTSSGGWATQNWDDVVRNALLMLDFGCAAHEDVWRVDGAQIRLRKLAARLPVTFYRWRTEADGETLLALEQYGYRGGQFLNVTLPADKIALFSYNQEGANFWGIALARYMYPHWYVKSHLYRIDAVACERNALGVPVWKLPPGFSHEDRDAAYNFVTQLAAHEATGAVEPPGDPSTGLRIVGYEGHVRDILPSIQHHNIMISRAALALFMDLAVSEHGSRSLGQQHGDFFLLSLQNLADQIAAVITSTSIRRLVEFNFGEDAPLPRLVAANVQARGLGAIVEALTRFAQAGLVVSEENLRRFIRQELALPEESKSAVVPQGSPE